LLLQKYFPPESLAKICARQELKEFLVFAEAKFYNK
jgi:hypothetical protein